MSALEDKPVIGVLALQGSFREHMAHVEKVGATAVEVRRPSQLNGCSGLIIPGGESTVMAKLARNWGLGGQELLGGLDCHVCRNFFGSQVDSFEAELPAHEVLKRFPTQGTHAEDTFRAVFIRAPAILEAGPECQVLSEYAVEGEPKRIERDGQISTYDKVITAVQQGSLLATAFHPELTADTRWHSLFVDLVQRSKLGPVSIKEEAPVLLQTEKPADLPVFSQPIA
eukprot:scaffold237_cov421-Prasinococcus_capsulatus_cf.AAC.13